MLRSIISQHYLACANVITLEYVHVQLHHWRELRTRCAIAQHRRMHYHAQVQRTYTLERVLSICSLMMRTCVALHRLTRCTMHIMHASFRLATRDSKHRASACLRTQKNVLSERLRKQK